MILFVSLKKTPMSLVTIEEMVTTEERWSLYYYALTLKNNADNSRADLEV